PSPTLPQDWDTATADGAPAAGNPEPRNAEPRNAEPRNGAEPQPNADLIAAFLAGAGLQHLPAGVDPAVAMRSLGESSRGLLKALAKVLAGRNALKSDFRIQQTVIGSRDNNPLKFATDEGCMLGVLLGGTPPGFTSGPAAVAEACRDLVAHQVALIVGFQAQLDL